MTAGAFIRGGLAAATAALPSCAEAPAAGPPHAVALQRTYPSDPLPADVSGAPPPSPPMRVGPDPGPPGQGSAGAVTAVGRVVPGGVECPMIELETGGRATLQGAGRLAVGVKVRVQGRWSDLSTCQQGRTIIASSVEVVE